MALLALAIACFGIGTTEFVVMGLLLDIARDLQVSVPDAGLLVSGYALGSAIGAPVLAMTTARLPRRAVLQGLMGLFILGNLFCAMAPSYGLLMAARVVTSFAQGAFFGLGAVVAAAIVPPERKARAIALMFAGVTLANITGVPLVTALGQELGWRAAFWAVAGIGVAAVVSLRLWLPPTFAVAGGGLMGEARALARRQVLLGMAASVLAAASLLSVFTYIAPILEAEAGLGGSGITLALLVFGLGLTMGNLAGGRLADWRLMPTVIGIFAGLILVFSLFTVTSGIPWAAVVTVFAWGGLFFALVPSLQMRVVKEAEGAPSLASTINQSAFNLGDAAGAWAGGLAIAQGVSYADLPWVGAALAMAGLAVTLLSHALDRRAPAQVPA